MKLFPLQPEEMVITSTYVTHDRLPILRVTHQYDEEDGHDWQFHCGNGDYSMEKMQLVRLSTILEIDPELESVFDLPVGHVASRASTAQAWVYASQ